MLLEAFKSLAKLAIDNEDDDTLGHAFTRIMQTTKKVQDKVHRKLGWVLSVQIGQ